MYQNDRPKRTFSSGNNQNYMMINSQRSDGMRFQILRKSKRWALHGRWIFPLELGLGLALALIQHLSLLVVSPVEDSFSVWDDFGVFFNDLFPGIPCPLAQISDLSATAAQMEQGLVEWRGCVAQLLNLISPVACFSEKRGVLPVTVPNCRVNGAFGPWDLHLEAVLMCKDRIGEL